MVRQGIASGWVPGRQRDEFEKRIVPWIRQQYLDEVKRHKPAFVVDYSDAGFVPLTTFPELQNELERHYVLVDQRETSWWFNPIGTIWLYKRYSDRVDRVGEKHQRRYWSKQNNVDI